MNDSVHATLIFCNSKNHDDRADMFDQPDAYMLEGVKFSYFPRIGETIKLDPGDRWTVFDVVHLMIALPQDMKKPDATLPDIYLCPAHAA